MTALFLFIFGVGKCAAVALIINGTPCSWDHDLIDAHKHIGYCYLFLVIVCNFSHRMHF